MKAQLWKITVSDGVMGAIHGQFSEIIELYVPSLGFTCNLYRNTVNFFKTEDRYTKLNINNDFNIHNPVMIKEIEISDNLATRINFSLELRDTASMRFSKFFKSLPEYIEFEKNKNEAFKENLSAYRIGLQNRNSPDNIYINEAINDDEAYINEAINDNEVFWKKARERISGVGRKIYQYFLLKFEKK